LNAATLQGAVAALSNKPGWTLSRGETAALIRELKRRNPEIADSLHADQGVRLMCVDSEITLAAMTACMLAGIAALPVHDSMLTTAAYGSKVAQVMEDSAARVLGMAKPCLVRLPASLVPHMPY
jgi:acyl-CoA synthetase (AMP-forming)/AMP-acid ligase II